MKKLLLSAAALMTFSIAISIFQMSCTKVANSQTPSYTLQPATTTKLGGVIPDGTTINVDATGKISAAANNTVSQAGKLLYGVFGATEAANAIWTSNYDGSSAQKININLPTGTVIDPDNIRLSPDHKIIFFETHTPPPAAITYSLYACNIDGTNVHLVKGAGANGISVAVAY